MLPRPLRKLHHRLHHCLPHEPHEFQGVPEPLLHNIHMHTPALVYQRAPNSVAQSHVSHADGLEHGHFVSDVAVRQVAVQGHAEQVKAIHKDKESGKRPYFEKRLLEVA